MNKWFYRDASNGDIFMPSSRCRRHKRFPTGTVCFYCMITCGIVLRAFRCFKLNALVIMRLRINWLQFRRFSQSLINQERPKLSSYAECSLQPHPFSVGATGWSSSTSSLNDVWWSMLRLVPTMCSAPRCHSLAVSLSLPRRNDKWTNASHLLNQTGWGEGGKNKIKHDRRNITPAPVGSRLLGTTRQTSVGIHNW